MANPEHLEILKKGVEVWNAWRIETSAGGPDLREADLHGMDLSGAKFHMGWLSGANLAEAELSGADLHEAFLIGASLEGANLQGADLHGANLREANLHGANLHGAKFRRVDLLGAYLRGAYIRALDLINWSDWEIRWMVEQGVTIEEDEARVTEDGGGAEGDDRNKVEALVEISLPQESIEIWDQERVVNAAGAFMEALGFAVEHQGEPIIGSLFQRFIFKTKKALTSKEAKELFEESKTALRAQLQDKPSAESTAQLATAASEVIKSLESIPNAAVRLGKLMVVKVTEDGTPRIMVETISLALQHKLEADPLFIREPQAVVDFLSLEKANELSKPHMQASEELLSSTSAPVEDEPTEPPVPPRMPPQEAT